MGLWVDRAMLACLLPVALAILVSGLDDLVVDIVWLAAWLRSKLLPQPGLFPPGPVQLESAPRRVIAVLLPLWHEHEVIGRMLEHNLTAIRYSDYHIFAGTYPNDAATQQAVRDAAARYPNVHLVLCPHDGPTSKADCLNWIYQHLTLHEEQHAISFDIIVTHDAEDLIHPDELHWINFYSARYDFIQTPVLALPTPFLSFTHGIYCDEFAEYHTRDMTVRPRLGGFLPSAGVGTGYRRSALEKLARAYSNRIFEPEALTEDYENGLRLFRLGCSQAFVPLCRTGRGFLATREYFPQTWRSALRQRTRWVTGIALQSWQRFGWMGKPGEVYWLWRDRKGLLANPLSVAANVLFVYGAATAMWTRASPLATKITWWTLGLQVLRTGVRMGCSGRVYGVRFALGVPLRAVYANFLNSAATVRAAARYASARLRGRPLKWLKTAHAFPSRATLLSHGIEFPLIDLVPAQIPRAIARALPEHFTRKWRVLPFKVAEGSLFIAGVEPPSAEMEFELRSFTALQVRFHLMNATVAR